MVMKISVPEYICVDRQLTAYDVHSYVELNTGRDKATMAGR